MARAGIYLTGKDVQLLTGLTLKASYDLIAAIKLAFKKNGRHHITVGEFCKYEMVSEEEVLKKLKR